VLLMGPDRVFHARRPQACNACAGVDGDRHLSPLAPDRAIEGGEAARSYARGDCIWSRAADRVSLGP
jgi:hypothetical protein